MRGERQKHGFLYEEEIINRYGMKKSTNYTSKWDAYINNLPVSIKTKKQGGSVELGDFFRQASVSETFLLCTGFWWGKKTSIVEEYFLLIDGNFWANQFNEELTESFKNIFEGITNSYDDDVKWKQRMREANEAWDKTGSIIKMNFKRDHKKQKRVQCSIRREAFQNILIPNFSIEMDSFLLSL